MPVGSGFIVAVVVPIVTQPLAVVEVKFIVYIPGNIPEGLNVLLDTPTPLKDGLEPMLVPVIGCGKPSWHTTIGSNATVIGGNTVIIQVVVYRHPADVVSVIVIVYTP
jgi:hypothetical protein